MKKHVIIVGILIVAGAFGLLALLFWSQAEESKDSPKPAMDSLDESVNLMGKRYWDKKVYDSIVVEINARSANGKMNASRKKSLLLSLDYSKQNALARSINASVNDSCKTLVNHFLIAEAKNFVSPIQNLKEAIQNQQDFQSVFSYPNKVKYFRNGIYSDNKANQIKESFKNLTNGKDFKKNCSEITKIRNEIFFKINEFKNFDKDFNFKKNQIETLISEDKYREAYKKLEKAFELFEEDFTKFPRYKAVFNDLNIEIENYLYNN